MPREKFDWFLQKTSRKRYKNLSYLLVYLFHLYAKPDKRFAGIGKTINRTKLISRRKDEYVGPVLLLSYFDITEYNTDLYIIVHIDNKKML